MSRSYHHHGMLTEGDRAILEFEGSWWLYPGPKDLAIRQYLGISATTYYQALRRLCEDPSAERTAPLTVRRMRRVRSDAQRRIREKHAGDSRPG
ncbi:MAG: DUF3263 domain-containing protein [Acidimicrobiia bacterium]|nr:MAG: DUF3263 domain-containing protein [Acidimicrobiia bacterium]